MKTAFSAQQLSDPDTAAAERVIRSCVRHGFCPQTCPTYVLTGDENDSPRGRIDLMRAMLERGGAPDKKTVYHLDRCLSCLGCETTCAARLDYRHLVDHARAYIEQHYRRPWRTRLLRAMLASVLPYPSRLRLALVLARLSRPLHGLLPVSLRRMAALAPPLERARTPAEPERSEAANTTTRRVALLGGCVQQVMAAATNAACARLLTRHGWQVVSVEAAGCCGALPLHMGRKAQARDHARALLAVLETCFEGPHPIDAIVIMASGCGTALKDYAALFDVDDPWHARALRVAQSVRDVSELLSPESLRVDADFPAVPLAYHPACSMQHGQRLGARAERLLSAAGFAVHNIPERHFCCGSAGTYNLLQADLATQLGQRKAAAIETTQAAAIAAGNLGCLVQIGHYTALPTVHTAELLDWATGGPRPAALADLQCTQWPPKATPAPAVSGAPNKPINFWTYAPSRAEGEP